MFSGWVRVWILLSFFWNVIVVLVEVISMFFWVVRLLLLCMVFFRCCLIKCMFFRVMFVDIGW